MQLEWREKNPKMTNVMYKTVTLKGEQTKNSIETQKRERLDSSKARRNT